MTTLSFRQTYDIFLIETALGLGLQKGQNARNGQH